jgi:hypothetical protein
MDKKVPNRKAGGLARANALSPEERKQAASAAALSRWNKGAPVATHEGIIKIGGIEIPCAVLPGEIRVISERGVTKALGGKRGGSHWKRIKQNPDGANLPVYLSAANLKPFISSELRLALNPIIYKSKDGGAVAYGIRAELLPEIFSVLIAARGAGALRGAQNNIADQADILNQGFSKLGAIGLVDEASGFQSSRARDALQSFLDAFLNKTFAAWSKRIPDQFYQEIYRLRGWEWPGMKKNRHQVVGKWTTDVIYKRLAPHVQEELERLNPKNSRGRRAGKHHQLLTEDIGHPALSHHVHAVLGLMRASKTWGQFKALLEVAFPVFGSHVQIELPGAVWDDLNEAEC